MFTRLRVTSLLVILGTTLLFGCATPTQRSADIATQEPHPSPINNFQIVIADGVYRSGQPKGEADWNYLKNIGIATVVKLNKFSSDADEAEEFRMAKERNIKVIPIYMQPEDFPHNLNPWDSPDLKDLMKVIEVLENRGNGNVLVHCSHGKDRTGLVVAVYSVRNKNFCKDAAYAQMKHYGANPILFGIKPLLDSPNISENPGCTHEYK
jgi:protein tyrosine/serine phosphatase